LSTVVAVSLSFRGVNEGYKFRRIARIASGAPPRWWACRMCRRLAITGKRYLGVPDGWWIARTPLEPSGEDAMSDFNLGQPVSTIPYTGYLVRPGCISTRVNAVPVTAPQEPGQPPIPLDPPRPSPWRRLRTLIFVVRTGARQVTQREVTDLIEEVRRAVPLDHHRDENPE
jgi:hypothetical protein